MTEAPREDETHGRVSITDYARAVEAGWTKDELMRAILHELPRRLHRLTPTERARVLAERPPLTATRWDALIAATVEHVAGLHGLSAPAWTDEPARFVPLVGAAGAGRAPAADLAVPRAAGRDALTGRPWGARTGDSAPPRFRLPTETAEPGMVPAQD